MIDTTAPPFLPVEAAEDKTRTNPVTDEDQVVLWNNALASPVRPCRISATVLVPADSFRWGLEFCQDGSTGQTIISYVDSNETYPFETGDILERINNIDCAGLDLADIFHQLYGSSGLVTLVVSTERFVKPPPGTHLDIVQATVIPPTCTCDDKNGFGPFPLGLEFCKKEEDTESEQGLQIASVSPNGWFHPSLLSPGDTILSINGTDCRELPADDAAMFLHVKSQVESQISIVALHRRHSNRNQKMLAKARRASVAVAGGSMVTVGAVVMATPLHPLGHALAIGGMGVLGTEFEAPKRSMRSLQQTVRSRTRWSHRMTKPSKEVEEQNPGEDSREKTVVA